MGQETVMGAQMMCSFGVAPSVLSPIPKGPPVMAGELTAVMFNNFPALTNSSKCMCCWAGVISIATPGPFTVEVP